MRNSVIVSPKRSMSSVLSRSAPLLALTLAATLLFSVNAAGITSSGMQHLTRDVFVSCRSRVSYLINDPPFTRSTQNNCTNLAAVA